MENGKPHGERRCTARSKRTGERCRQPVCEGKTVCRFHGARGGRPPLHGKYSTVWATRLAARMEAAASDPQLFNQHKRVAFLHGLWEDAVERMLTLSETAPAELWAQAQRALATLKTAIQSGDQKGFKEALAALETALDNGRGIEQAERKACALVTQIAEVSRTQFQGVKTAAEVVTAQELQLFVARCIREFRGVKLDGVRDPERIRQIFAAAIIRAVGQTTS